MAIARHKTRQREVREAQALLRRVQRGEPRAFALLYATYESRLYRLCHRLTGDPETASALVRLTFARALADLPDGELDALDVPAYLHATALALAYERNGGPPGPGGREASEVGIATQRLSSQERAVLALRDLEGRPDAEIASVLGTEESAVPGLVGTARLRLHAEMRLPGAVTACPGRLPELSAHGDGTLPADRRPALEQHVAGCARCRAVLFAMREAAMRYRALPVPEPPGDLGSRISLALGAVGLPAHSTAAAESVTTGGRQTAVAVAMAALAIVGVGVTIAAARDDHGGKSAPSPAPPPPPPAAQPSGPGSGSSASAAITSPARRTQPAPPVLHHLRAGAQLTAPTRPAARQPSVAETLGLGKSFAPESPPPAPPVAPASPAPPVPATTARPRDIPVDVLPPTLPAQTANADQQPAPPPAPAPPPPAPAPPVQTTST